MTTQKSTILALSRGFNGFFCPESRFHLIGKMKPQAVYSHPVLTEDVKRGIRSGVLIDVNQVFSEEDVAAKSGFVAHVTSQDRKNQVIEAANESKEKEREKTGEEPKPVDFGQTTGEIMSETDIDTATKKVLVAFIEKTEGISFETLGLNGSSVLDDVRLALKKHFGYAVETTTEKDGE